MFARDGTMLPISLSNAGYADVFFASPDVSLTPLVEWVGGKKGGWVEGAVVRRMSHPLIETVVIIAGR